MKEHYYKIGMAAREAGVSAQNIRYYEQEKLIHLKRVEDSTTRTLTVQQIRQITNIRRLFKMGFSKEEVRKIQDSSSLSELGELYEKKRLLLEEEERELQMRKQRLEEMRAGLEKAAGQLGMINEEINPPLCYLLTRQGQKLNGSAETTRMSKIWAENIHLTSLGTVFPMKVLSGQADYSKRLLGHCADERVFSMNRTESDTLMRMPERRCIHIVCKKEKYSEIGIKCEDYFPQVYAYLREHRYRFSGEAFGRILAVVGEEELRSNGKPKAVYSECWFPIE